MADKRLLLAHLADPKTAGTLPVTHDDFRSERRLRRFNLRSGELVMSVGGVFRAADDQQVWLDHPDWPLGHLVRLCICRLHQGEPHAHYFEGPGEPRDTRPLSIAEPARLSDPGYLLTEVFVPMLHVDGLIYQGRL